MKTLTLTSVTLEISNVNFVKQMPRPTTPTLGHPDLNTKVTVLNVIGSLKLGSVEIAHLSKQYTLTDAELLATTLSGLDDLGLTKVSTEFGI